MDTRKNAIRVCAMRKTAAPMARELEEASGLQTLIQCGVTAAAVHLQQLLVAEYVTGIGNSTGSGGNQESPVLWASGGCLF